MATLKFEISNTTLGTGAITYTMSDADSQAIIDTYRVYAATDINPDPTDAQAVEYLFQGLMNGITNNVMREEQTAAASSASDAVEPIDALTPGLVIVP